MTLEQRITVLENRVDMSEQKHMALMTVFENNSKLIAEIADDTKEIRQIWDEARGAFRLFTKIMAAIRWLFKFIIVPVVLLFVAVYAWTHNGKPPDWIHSFVKIIE